MSIIPVTSNQAVLPALAEASDPALQPIVPTAGETSLGEQVARCMNALHTLEAALAFYGTAHELAQLNLEAVTIRPGLDTARTEALHRRARRVPLRQTMPEREPTEPPDDVKRVKLESKWFRPRFEIGEAPPRPALFEETGLSEAYERMVNKFGR